MTPRDYQEECRNDVLAAWGEKPWHEEGDTYRSVLINLPTSAGKTVVIGMIIQAVEGRGRCLFLADTDELCAQPRDKFYRLFDIRASIEKASEKASRLADVVIGSAQTLIREERRRRFAPDHFSYIFVDEAHRGSDRNKEITDYFSGAKVCGCTATAFRAKLADLSDYYEHVAYEMGLFDLVDEGYIVPYKVLTLPVVVDIRQVHQTMSTEGMDYDKNELDTKIAPYYERICELIVEHAPDRHIICYLPLIKSSQEFVTIARSMGINARHIDGKSPDRERILEEFDRGRIQLLSNSSLLTTGWDCPRCDCLLNLAPTRSMGMFRQKAGRPGRVLPGIIDGIATKEERRAKIGASAKPDALILDLLWQVERFGLMGPADLIAGNADERLAIQIRLDRLTSPADLQSVSVEVQADREAALKKALQDAAKRRSTFNDAINLVAAMLHGRKVLDYEPVMKWESRPVTEKQKDWMERQGIDPDSAKDRGHVSALMNLLFNRRRAGLCSHKVVEALEQRGIAGAISFTDRQAYEILGGHFPCSFGKKTLGKPLRSIATSFWEWCVKQDWFERRYPIEWNWAQGILKPNGGCTCIGAYVAPNCPVHPRKAKPPAPAFPGWRLSGVKAEDFDCLDPK